jgi:hypothetical protein
MLTFCVVAPRKLVGTCQRFGETCCLHLQGSIVTCYNINFTHHDAVIHKLSLLFFMISDSLSFTFFKCLP